MICYHVAFLSHCSPFLCPPPSHLSPFHALPFSHPYPLSCPLLMCLPTWVYMYHMCTGAHGSQKRWVRALRGRITGCCEPPYGFWEPNWILCQSSMCFEPLSHLPRPLMWNANSYSKFFKLCIIIVKSLLCAECIICMILLTLSNASHFHVVNITSVVSQRNSVSDGSKLSL